MTKLRTFMFAALAAIVALGIGGQALAQDAVPHIQARAMPVVPHANVPAARTGLNQGILGIGPLPPAGADGGDSWPCFAGAADCPNIAGGGLVVGEPILNWSLSDCTVKGSACAQYYWTFEDDAASGEVSVGILVTQGTNTIQKIPLTDLGVSFTGSPGSLYWVKCDCVTFKKAVAATGPATVTVTTQVGKKTITGTMTINLE